MHRKVIPCLGAAHGADQAGSGWLCNLRGYGCVWHTSRTRLRRTHTQRETVTHALFSSAETEISFPSLGVSFTPINRSDSCAKGDSPRQPQRLATLSLRWLSLTAAHQGRRLLRRLGGKKLDPLDRLFWPRSQVKMPWAKFSFLATADTCTNIVHQLDTSDTGHCSLHSSTGGQGGSDPLSPPRGVTSLRKKSGYFRATHTHMYGKYWPSSTRAQQVDNVGQRTEWQPHVMARQIPCTQQRLKRKGDF